MLAAVVVSMATRWSGWFGTSAALLGWRY